MKPTMEQRERAAREWLREHHAECTPDAGFVARVSAKLEERSAGTIGWVAMRMLPVAAALVAVLGLAAWSQAFVAVDTDSASAVAVSTVDLSSDDLSAEDYVSPSDDLLTWVLNDPERGSP